MVPNNIHEFNQSSVVPGILFFFVLDPSSLQPVPHAIDVDTPSSFTTSSVIIQSMIMLVQQCHKPSQFHQFL